MEGYFFGVFVFTFSGGRKVWGRCEEGVRKEGRKKARKKERKEWRKEQHNITRAAAAATTATTTTTTSSTRSATKKNIETLKKTIEQWKKTVEQSKENWRKPWKIEENHGKIYENYGQINKNHGKLDKKTRNKFWNQWKNWWTVRMIDFSYKMQQMRDFSCKNQGMEPGRPKKEKMQKNITTYCNSAPDLILYVFITYLYLCFPFLYPLELLVHLVTIFIIPGPWYSKYHAPGGSKLQM